MIRAPRDVMIFFAVIAIFLALIIAPIGFMVRVNDLELSNKILSIVLYLIIVADVFILGSVLRDTLCMLLK